MFLGNKSFFYSFNPFFRVDMLHLLLSAWGSGGNEKAAVLGMVVLVCVFWASSVPNLPDCVASGPDLQGRE